jgi:predicted anti-sigma-YlaC factor YlaD
MSDRTSPEDDLTCIDLVRGVSAYLDGEVDAADGARIERHLDGCAGCRATIDQFRTVIRLAGRLSAADVASIDPLIRDRLMATLRIPRRR